MGATAASCGSSPFIPRENSLAGYIKGFSKLVAQNQLEGILATAWDDGSPHSETVWRGYIAQENMAGTQQHGQSKPSKPHMPNENLAFIQMTTIWLFWMNWNKKHFL